MPGLTKHDFAKARAAHTARRSHERAAAEREAFEERAAIIEEGAKVDRSTAERWARECIARVRGAV